MNKFKITILIILLVLILFLSTSYKVVELRLDETELLTLINNARAEKNLQPLAIDSNLERIAQERSNDMITRGYFSHYTPEGRRVRYGETISLGLINIDKKWVNQNVNVTVLCDSKYELNSLLSSYTHRTVIMDRIYKKVGIGVAYNNENVIITILFSSR